MKYRKTLLYAATAAMLLLQTGLAAAPDQFTPGSTDIDEAQILRQIETEIGLRKPKLQDTEKNQKNSSENEIDPHRFRLKATQGDGTSVLGYTRLSQESIWLHQTGHPESETVMIPLTKIRRVEIKSWRISRLIETAPRKYRVYFFPDECVVTDTTGRSLSGTIDARNWLQMTLEDGILTTSLRSYFTMDIEAVSIETARQLALSKMDRPGDVLNALLFIPESSSATGLPGELESASQR